MPKPASESLAERARKIGGGSEDPWKRQYIRREWWLITKPGATKPIEVFVDPCRSYAEMHELRVYKGCKIVAK